MPLLARRESTVLPNVLMDVIFIVRPGGLMGAKPN